MCRSCARNCPLLVQLSSMNVSTIKRGGEQHKLDLEEPINLADGVRRFWKPVQSDQPATTVHVAHRCASPPPTTAPICDGD